jgi:hypothetical protein
MLTCVILVSSLSASRNEENSFTDHRQSFADNPASCWDVLGSSVLERTIQRLQRSGLNAITVVAERQLSSLLAPIKPPASVKFAELSTALWSTTTRIVADYVQQGAGTVLLLKLGPYAEFDLADLLRFYQKQHQSLTPIEDSRGIVAGWVIGSDHIQQATTAGILDITAVREGTAAVPYILRGYVNSLEDARDYRRLVVDAFLSRCAIRPTGREVKPGIWIDEGARVHRHARIVAPAYVGRAAKLREDALVTRFSNLEQRCEVDRGTLVETTSVLGNTYLGKGLVVCHAVVDGSKILHLQHNAMVEINDTNLLGRTITSEQTGPISETSTGYNLARRLLETAWSQIVS